MKMNGIVKRYDDRRGYGIIAPLIGKPDACETIFFHVSGIRRGKDGQPQAIPSGAEVRFRLVRGPKGRPQAADVEVVELPSSVLQSPTSGSVAKTHSSRIRSANL